MKRSNTIGVSYEHLTDYKQRAAFHEAGHAVAIHLYNRQKNLPPVYFQIVFKADGDRSFKSKDIGRVYRHEPVARIDGGRLIQSLPLAVTDNQASAGDNSQQSLQDADAYRTAFEADIVNLLIGPIAEAKYIAWLDDEPFHHQLLTVQALKNYGGEEDLVVIRNYLQSYTFDLKMQSEILHRLFMQAYHFVNDRKHWKAITRLANHILDSKNEKIGCEAVAFVLEGH